MASLCTRCALRFRRAATTATADSAPLSRTFTTSHPRRAHAVPQFSETPHAELNHVLASMRDMHFVPAALTPAQRRLIFGHRNRENLTNYPQAVDVAGETVELQWIDRRAEIPNRTKLFKRALKLMAEDGSHEAWRNLVHLLVGLKRSRVEISATDMEQLMRLATNSGHFNEIISCLRRGEETGMTMQRPEVLEGVLMALRHIARGDGWGQQSMERALTTASQVAQLLEMEMHGGGKRLKTDDLRKDPRVIGVFLELSAVFAEKHQGGKDADGRVKAYAERLLYNIQGGREASILDTVLVTKSANLAWQISTTEPAPRGPQKDILLGLSIWHGLKVAQRILADDMPNPALVAEVVDNYARKLEDLIAQLQRQTLTRTPGGYADQALTAWEDCQ